MPAALPSASDLRHPAAGGAPALREWLARHRRVFVLTGAGLSTNSGIPDYRDADGQWKRPPPVGFAEFLRDPAVRRRYWARSFLGWPRVDAARPNGGHSALAALERGGRLAGLVTQNVDGLHARAGHREVIDLHGRIDEVVCLGCGWHMPRSGLQAELAMRNPAWSGRTAVPAPDGDADVEPEALGGFEPVDCARCGGLLKPHVVFFGENVPRPRVEAARDALGAADAMLVVGSSLMVYSGFRFARMAHAAGLPLAILNRGLTRADPLAGLKIDADCEATLVAALDGGDAEAATWIAAAHTGNARAPGGG